MPGVGGVSPLGKRSRIHDKRCEMIFTLGYHKYNTNPPPFSRLGPGMPPSCLNKYDEKYLNREWI